MSNVSEVPFVHYIVDLSLRDVTTSKGDVVTICQIEANAPIDLSHGETPSRVYSFGGGIDPTEPFEFEVGCFCFILVGKCCGDIGLFAVSHIIPEDPTFHSLVYEGDKLVSAENSHPSIDLKANFYFASFNAGQRLRIETIPDLETHWIMTGIMKKNQEEGTSSEETP